MGEQIELLGELSVGGEKFSVDANLGLSGPGGRDIHIQNEKLRFQMYERDFISVSCQSCFGTGKNRACQEARSMTTNSAMHISKHFHGARL